MAETTAGILELVYWALQKAIQVEGWPPQAAVGCGCWMMHHNHRHDWYLTALRWRCRRNLTSTNHGRSAGQAQWQSLLQDVAVNTVNDTELSLRDVQHVCSSWTRVNLRRQNTSASVGTGRKGLPYHDWVRGANHSRPLLLETAPRSVETPGNITVGRDSPS